MTEFRQFAKRIPGLRPAVQRLRRLRQASRARIFEDIYTRNQWGDRDSASGIGSNLSQTARIRQELPDLWRRHNVGRVLDAPCGDFYWMREISGFLDEYIGVDIVKALIESNNQLYGNARTRFLHADLVKDPLPASHLILCRDCLVHLSYRDIWRALSNMRRSGASYLLTTTFTEHMQNQDILNGQWWPFNLQQPPFSFPPPIEIVNEDCTLRGDEFADKSLALWRLSDLPRRAGRRPRFQSKKPMVEITFSYRGRPVCLVAPDGRDALPKWVQQFRTFYEPEVLEQCELYIQRLGRTGETIVDVGAHIGNHTVFFAVFCQAKQVIAFEPSQLSFEALNQTIAHNGLRNVTGHQLALGSRDGWGTIEIPDPGNTGANRVRSGMEEGSNSVRITSLDAFIESSGVPAAISLIKIDVEGMECEVLAGAAKSIARFKPILCIEILDGAHMRRVNEILKHSSYLIRYFGGGAPTYILTWESRIPRALVQAINAGWLLLAHHGNNAMRWYYHRLIEIALPI